MKFIVKISLLSLACMPQLYASQMQVPRSYQGCVIKESNIAALAPQAPEALQKVTHAWLAENPQVAATALGYESFIPTADITLEDGTKRKTIMPLIDATNEMLKQQGTENVSPFNYVFQHPKDPAWLVKIAGHINRKYGISHLAQALEMDGSPWGKEGYNFHRALTQADYDRFAQELPADAFDKVIQKNGQLMPVTTAPKTYQHISRVAHYLLLLEAIEQQKLFQVTAPAMHLIHIPGRPTEVSDRNYIVVEKKIDGLQDIKQLSAEEDKQLEAAVRATGLFNINQENCKRTADGKVAILDFEQPNNSLPNHFFHASPARFVNNMQAGLNSLNGMRADLAMEQAQKEAKDNSAT